ncbi:hypothetical protein CC78DRAFT_541028 [Lojkania enalia]|uniref:DRBM domain-containing protein n=1 Tax=Lojkania enalia TaxID=147567 RepID=A0A9P4KHJ8_9PLEO|nr:hypothetical protein CC78DRAFT_541028 [Didymosphaeria enalia]
MDDLLSYLIPPSRQQERQPSLNRLAHCALTPNPANQQLTSHKRNRASSMDIEQSPSTGGQPALPADNSTTYPAEALESVRGIDEYLAQYRPEATSQPPRKKPAGHGGVSSNGSLGPVALGSSSRSSKNVVELHEKVQAFGVSMPHFVFDGSFEGWACTAMFLDETFEGAGPYSSKKAAKEAVSAMVLNHVKKLEEEGKLKKPGKKTDKKVLRTEPQVVKQDPGENYVGQLIEFQQSNHYPLPLYTDYQLGIRYASELILPNLPSFSFGSKTDLFNSKKAAHKNAAYLAIQYYKATKQWPESLKESHQPQPQLLQPQSLTPTSLDSNNTASFASRVAALATDLGLVTPEYHYASDARAPGFHTVSCFFKNGGRHEGPLGTVRHVFGKKNAKEACARLVFAYLVEVREERSRMAREVLDRGDDAEAKDVESGEDKFESADEGVTDLA